MEVRQGIFELTDSRKLNGWHLHPETRIFAAVNGGEHAGASSYQVGEMDPAELDRWTVFDVEPTIEDWLNWANGNVDGIVWDFINQNRGHLEHIGEFEPNKVYPSRRSWDRLSECLVGGTLLGEEAKEKTETIYHLATAFVGFEAAVALTDFVKTYEKLVTVADILEHGNVEKTETFGINEHTALVEKMEAEKVFAGSLPEEQVTNLASYFVTLPSEVAMKLWTVMGEGEIQNTVSLHQSEVNGVAVSSFLVELLTGQAAS
jgi:hypothetical protein